MSINGSNSTVNWDGRFNCLKVYWNVSLWEIFPFSKRLKPLTKNPITETSREVIDDVVWIIEEKNI